MRRLVLKLLLAIDDSPCSQAAVDAVIAERDPVGTSVQVLHVVEWPNGGPAYLWFATGPAAIDGVLALRERALDAGRLLAARAAERLQSAGFPVSTNVRAGDARDEIVDAARRLPADLIVMGSHGRRGLDRFALGSVAETVVRRAACSVQIVRRAKVTAARTSRGTEHSQFNA